MEVIRGVENIPKIKNSVVTTGSFDGVHVGHQFIINRLNELAAEIDGKSVLITFFPHPRKVLYPDNKVKMISSQEEKIEILRQTKLDYLIILDFTIEFSQTPSVDFVRNILIDKIGAKVIVIGYDHHFGHNREGDISYLYDLSEKHDFRVEQVSAKGVDFEIASSTKIREALETGNIQRANAFLQHYYVVIGKFLEGRAFTKWHDFTTICIEVEETSKQLPHDGVYAISVDVKDRLFRGMLNIKHSHNLPKGSIIEAHLFDLDEDILGEVGKVYFHKRIRQEMRFDRKDLLERQLILDKMKIEDLIF